MKKSKAKIYISGLLALLILTGCANKGSEDQSAAESLKQEAVSNENTVPITSVKESFLEDANALRAQTFDNMSFANTYFVFPQTDNVHIFEHNMTDFNISPDDAYEYMCKRLDELFPGTFSDEEKAGEIRFYDVGNMEEYPTFEQYKAMEERNYPFILSDHPTTGINTNRERYLSIINGILQAYDDGSLAKRSGFNRGLGSFNILGEFNVIYRTENLESERTFHLKSGDISIAEAVESAEKQLSEFELSERELPFNLRIQNVNVMDIGDNCCAFYFGIVPEYKGVEFNCMLPDENVFGFGIISDSTNEHETCGEAIMLETDKICRYRMVYPATFYDITELSSADTVIPLKYAAKTASEYLAPGINGNVLSVQAVYKSFSDNNIWSVDHDVYERRTITVRTCWRFALQPLSNTGRLYYIFVDMLTGKAYSTVQQMGSEVMYD